jgi:S1-C subfamily serine protease
MLSHPRPTALVFMLSVISLTPACASAARHSFELPRARAETGDRGLIPGDRKKIEALRPGSPLVVSLKDGNCFEGAVKAMSAGVLTLTDRAGTEFAIPMSDVARIVERFTSDGLANGAAIGAGIGLAAAVAILAGLDADNGYVLPTAKVGAPLLLSGIGALIGALVDRSHRSERVLYVAP